MLTAHQARFVRRTILNEGERRVNFRQIDNDILSALTSEEALAVTHSMSHVYLCLANAPVSLFERPGVIHFGGEILDDRQLTAWEQLLKLTNIAGATLKKALAWMQGQGIIGYFAGKNGVGIRIFLNRASASIAAAHGPQDQKNLRLVRTSTADSHLSENEAAFNKVFLEVQDTEIKKPAPKNGAGQGNPDVQNDSGSPKLQQDQEGEAKSGAQETFAVLSQQISSLESKVVARLKSDLEPLVCSIAAKSISSLSAREFAQTRVWFETKALPKAVRVAQHETFALLRKNGVLNTRTHKLSTPDVGRRFSGNVECNARNQSRSESEILEIAESCLALEEIQGKTIDHSLNEMSTESGGWLQPSDVVRVRQTILGFASK